jgi:hypothetical protein
VGLAGGEEEVHLVVVPAHLERPLEAALVGDQHREGDAVPAPHPLEHLGAVGELGDHVRADE